MATEAKMSDVYEALALVDRRHPYLCNALTSLMRLPPVLQEFPFELRAETAKHLSDWLRWGYGAGCLINVYRRFAIEDLGEDGVSWDNDTASKGLITETGMRRSLEDAYFAEVRPKFCRDTAAFLREFGL